MRPTHRQSAGRIDALERQVADLKIRLADSTNEQLRLLLLLKDARGNEPVSASTNQVYPHLNDASLLAPVDCPLVIETEPGVLVEARRTVFVPDRKGQMEYQLLDGSLIRGRYRWTYP